MNISRKAKQEIRSFIVRNGSKYCSAPIVLQNGNSKPHWAGKSFHYKNKSGNLIKYPNAYRKAWGKPIYVPSTIRIVVGKEWLKQLEIDLVQVKLSRERKTLVHRDLAKFALYFGESDRI